VLLADDERTYDLIDKMLKTCAECFTSRNIHIGMDEAHSLGRGKYLDAHGEKSRFDILLKHLNRVSEIAEKYGFKPMMWSDMFFRIAGGGEYYHKKPIPQEVTEKVPQNVQLVYWDYYNEDEELLECMTKHHLDFRRDVWIAGGAWKWCGFQSDNKKSLAQTEKFIRAAKKQGVNDILITLWGDNGGECSPYAVLPSLLYAAECARGNFDAANAKKKFEALFGESWDDFMLCDLPCPEPLAKTGYRLGVKEMLYSDYFLSSFDCGVSGTGEEREAYGQFAKLFAEAAKRSKNYAYLFESYAALSRALAVKYDLGYRTRKAYEQGDKQALALLVSDYEKTLALLEEFAQTYEKQWLKENKPHGFDVQDIRLGGIIQRTKSCMRRLKAYVGGEISKIDELEEPDVDFSTGGAPKRNGVRYNCYQVIASANVI
ncbi:MAG: family 20 glycosylhydrolase, partial [Candidatus Scatosoma sp.]